MKKSGIRKRRIKKIKKVNSSKNRYLFRQLGILYKKQYPKSYIGGVDTSGRPLGLIDYLDTTPLASTIIYNNTFGMHVSFSIRRRRLTKNTKLRKLV